MPQVKTNATLALVFLLTLGGCSDGESPLSPASTRDMVNPQAQPISSPGQPLANNLARAVALAMNDPEVRLMVRNTMRDSRFHEHKIHLRSFLDGRDGERLRASIAAALNTSAANVSRVLDHLPDMEFYLPEKDHRLQWTGESDYFVMAVESPGDFKNPYVLLYDPNGQPEVVDVINAMPEEAVFALLPVEADFSRPDVPTRSYKGETVQSMSECHPLEAGCTRDGVRSTDFMAYLSAISDTTAFLERFYLRKHMDGLGSNEIEMWYWLEGSPEDPGAGYPDSSGASCIRFTGIDAGGWYNLHRNLGDNYPREGRALESEFYEDDMLGCAITVYDDGMARIQTTWADLYPSYQFQEVRNCGGDGCTTFADVSFSAPVTFLLTATISGPVSLAEGESGIWSAGALYGVGPYSYKWFKDGALVSTGYSYQTIMGSESFMLQVTVTDQGTGATDSASRSVQVESACSDPTQVIC